VQVTVKLFATLRKGRFDVARRELSAGATIADVLAELDIDGRQPLLCFLNGRQADGESVLHDDDVVALFPPIGGG
jgi:molybdopterin synthase sulfur carrier subunit